MSMHLRISHKDRQSAVWFTWQKDIGTDCTAHEEGQSTIEFIAVVLALTAITVALMAFVKFAVAGGFGELATKAASHSVSGWGFRGLLYDVFMF